MEFTADDPEFPFEQSDEHDTVEVFGVTVWDIPEDAVAIGVLAAVPVEYPDGRRGLSLRSSRGLMAYEAEGLARELLRYADDLRHDTETWDG